MNAINDTRHIFCIIYVSGLRQENLEMKLLEFNKILFFTFLIKKHLCNEQIWQIL